MDNELKFLKFKGKKIAYLEEGLGPNIFLLHGMNGSSRSWEYLFDELKDAFRLVAWDAPSFGETDVFGDQLEDFVCVAKFMVKELGLDNAVIVGHSMGGVIAARLAAIKSLSFRGLVLSSTHLGFGKQRGEELMPRYANRISAIEENRKTEAYRLCRAKGATANGAPPEVVNFLANAVKKVRLEAIRDGGRMSQEANNRNIASEIDVPVLILSGGKDKVISSDMHKELLEEFPKAEKVIFPDSGHASYAEKPLLFNQQIRKFVKIVNLNPAEISN